MNRASLPGDIAIGLWFALAAAAFWAPYLGFALPAGPLNALYAVFLLVSLTVLALRLLRQSQEPAAAGPAARLVHPPEKEALHRGR
jgi:hypothetical protein